MVCWRIGWHGLVIIRSLTFDVSKGEWEEGNESG